MNHPEFKLMTISRGLCLYAYVDADHARDVDTRRSVTAYVFHLGDSPICWKSKLQQCVATSSMQSEYMALCSACLQSLGLLRSFVLLGTTNWIPLSCLRTTNRALSTLRTILHMIGPSILKLSITWCENKFSREILLWPKFQQRRMSLIF